MRCHIDTHVHVYHCYEPDDFLSAAISNSAMAGSADTLILCLTESNGFNFFNELKSQSNANKSIAGWTISSLPNQPVVLLSKDQKIIIFIAGSQIITAQGLEVLALFNEKRYEDGQDVQTIIDHINDDQGIAVLPWGVGKWLGQRGKTITKLLDVNSPDKLAIADISSRPTLWPQPEQFKLAKQSGFSCLYGTDPLPIKYDQGRIASAGMSMVLSNDTVQAISELKASLLKQANNKKFGDHITAFRFVKDQLMLRLNKKACLTTK